MKICSKVLSSRLQKILYTVIHPDQHAFIKGRNIAEAIRNVQDMFYYLTTENKNNYIVSIDFRKAFDSIDHEFICKALESVGFGPMFIKWVKTLYCNIEGCVLNNGTSTGYFPISRGVRQGDPLSPYLFLIAIEMLATRLRNTKEIRGITFGPCESKLSLYADDFCAFCLDQNSVVVLLDVLRQFDRCSSLTFNRDKT